MLNEKDITRISKLMSLVLRHKPETIGLHLDENGWASTDELIEKMNQHGTTVTQEILLHVVDTNSKKRFALSEDHSKIRANQGHSIEVELNLQQQTPPTILYHGTGEKSIASILESGLQKRSRHHVHLSADISTAIAVGSRHGKPAVFEVAAAEMNAAAHVFYLSENGVWLTDDVPAGYLKLLNHKEFYTK